MTAPHTQLGEMSDGGWLTTQEFSLCWNCNEPSHSRKPGAKNDIWRCVKCDVKWEWPTRQPR